MESKDVIQLIRLQRHDLMNDLQIVHGYLSMGKTDKVKKKVSEMIESFHQERKLMNINCPEFSLWLTQAKWLYNNIKITYDIHTEKNDMQIFDQHLTVIGKALVEAIKPEEYGVVEVQLIIEENNTAIEMEISLDKTYFQQNMFQERIKTQINKVWIKVQEMGSKVTYTLTIPA